MAALALAFGIGARDVVRNMLAGYYVRENLSLGDKLDIDGEIGTLESIGTVSSEVFLSGARLVIPNSELMDTIVRVARKKTDDV